MYNLVSRSLIVWLLVSGRVDTSKTSFSAPGDCTDICFKTTNIQLLLCGVLSVSPASSWAFAIISPFSLYLVKRRRTVFVTNFRICFKPFCKLCLGFQILVVLDISVCVRRHHLAILALVQHLLVPVDTNVQVRLGGIITVRSLHTFLQVPLWREAAPPSSPDQVAKKCRVSRQVWVRSWSILASTASCVSSSSWTESPSIPSKSAVLLVVIVSCSNAPQNQVR